MQLFQYLAMSHFSSLLPLPEIPDNFSIPQFFLQDTSESLQRPQRPSNAPFFIEDRTSRQITYEQVGLPDLYDGSNLRSLIGPSSYK